jgi:hypothetical protein
VKAEYQKPSGMLQSLDMPVWKWKKITMDFVIKLPRTKRRNDTIWVIVDRLTKSAVTPRFQGTSEGMTNLQDVINSLHFQKIFYITAEAIGNNNNSTEL